MEESRKEERKKPSRGEGQEHFNGHGISTRREESSVETQNRKLDKANGKNVPELHYEHNLPLF